MTPEPLHPLTPADCDLRDFAYMPLDVQRLCDSDLAALEPPEACWAALLLWCKAWHQVPAASLPDDDRVLAKFTGYQRAPQGWADIREGALRGWVKCSDGRLYHPVVAEKANEAWFAKHRQAHEKLCERIRKRNKARAEKGLLPLEIPELEQWIEMGCPLEKSLFPAEFRTPSTGKPSDFIRKEGALPPEESGSSAEDSGSPLGKIDEERARRAAERVDTPEFLNSAGFVDSSAGNAEDFHRKGVEIPPENALKGKEREGNGEVNLKTVGAVIVTDNPARAPFDDFTPKDASEWRRYFAERHGVDLDPTNVNHRTKAWPLFASWTNAGISTRQMDAAVAKAQAEATETIAFLPAYVDRVLATMGAPPRASPVDERAERRRKAAYELTHPTITQGMEAQDGRFDDRTIDAELKRIG